MTRTISFRTPGFAPLEALTTLGVSIKVNENPIGFFGTGFKFALAWCLRNNHSLKVRWSDGREVSFSTKPVTIRDRAIQIVYAVISDGTEEKLGFTKDLGPTWKAWQAYRELHANTKDENGVIFEGNAVPEGDETIISVTGPSKGGIAEAFDDRCKIFLVSKPIWENAHVSIHPGPASHVYYRGVRVKKLDHPSNLTYNLLSERPLSEDRTLVDSDWSIAYDLCAALADCDSSAVLPVILSAKQDTFEHDFGWRHIQAEHKVGQYLVRNVGAPLLTVNALFKARELADRVAVPTEIVLSNHQTQMLREAVSVCNEAGYNVDAYPIKLFASLGRNIVGLAVADTIHLSPMAFEKGLKDLVATLIEEWMHLRFDVQDHTPGMQNKLFELLTTEIATRLGRTL